MYNAYFFLNKQLDIDFYRKLFVEWNTFITSYTYSISLPFKTFAYFDYLPFAFLKTFMPNFQDQLKTRDWGRNQLQFIISW